MVTLGIGSNASKKNIRLISIDPFKPYQDEYDTGLNNGLAGDYVVFTKNISAFGLSVTNIVKKSLDAAKEIKNNSIDLVFIDGCHVYSDVKADILVSKKKIKSGGIICGHDYWSLHPGVIKAVNEICGIDGFKIHGLSIWVANE